MGESINSQSSGKKYDMLTKFSKDTLNINDANTLYSLRVAKYNKNEFQNLQDLEEKGEGLVRFQFKHGYVEEQLFTAVSMNSYKNGSHKTNKNTEKIFIKED